VNLAGVSEGELKRTFGEGLTLALELEDGHVDVTRVAVSSVVRRGRVLPASPTLDVDFRVTLQILASSVAASGLDADSFASSTFAGVASYLDALVTSGNLTATLIAVPSFASANAALLADATVDVAAWRSPTYTYTSTPVPTPSPQAPAPGSANGGKPGGASIVAVAAGAAVGALVLFGVLGALYLRRLRARARRVAVAPAPVPAAVAPQSSLGGTGHTAPAALEGTGHP
jgi:hypothetical protein